MPAIKPADDREYDIDVAQPDDLDIVHRDYELRNPVDGGKPLLGAEIWSLGNLRGGPRPI